MHKRLRLKFTLTKAVSAAFLTLFILATIASSSSMSMAATGKKAKAKKEPVPQVLKNWTHELTANASDGTQEIKVAVTYYSNEYVEQLIASETEKNLWTQDEAENYKYTLLKNLNLAETIPFHIYLRIQGMPCYASPFDKHFTLMIGKKKYKAVDYDRRFNFKLLGEREGMIYFPRYDETTGKPILEGAKDIRLLFTTSPFYALNSYKTDITWIWDLSRDRGSINGGKAADRLEIDRLQKRTDKLDEERRKLQRQLDALNKEYKDVNSRIDELQSK